MKPGFPNSRTHVQKIYITIAPLGFQESDYMETSEPLKLARLQLVFPFFAFRAKPAAYGSSQARGRIGATAAGLHHSHSNEGSELCLRPTPRIMAMPDP